VPTSRARPARCGTRAIIEDGPERRRSTVVCDDNGHRAARPPRRQAWLTVPEGTPRRHTSHGGHMTRYARADLLRGAGAAAAAAAVGGGGSGPPRVRPGGPIGEARPGGPQPPAPGGADGSRLLRAGDGRRRADRRARRVRAGRPRPRAPARRAPRGAARRRAEVPTAVRLRAGRPRPAGVRADRGAAGGRGGRRVQRPGGERVRRRARRRRADRLRRGTARGLGALDRRARSGARRHGHPRSEDEVREALQEIGVRP
jgi:hypothetical protein